MKIGSKCSFITHKLRFFANFCLALAASKTFFNGLLASWLPLNVQDGSGLKKQKAEPMLRFYIQNLQAIEPDSSVLLS